MYKCLANFCRTAGFLGFVVESCVCGLPVMASYCYIYSPQYAYFLRLQPQMLLAMKYQYLTECLSSKPPPSLLAFAPRNRNLSRPHQRTGFWCTGAPTGGGLCVSFSECPFRICRFRTRTRPAAWWRKPSRISPSLFGCKERSWRLLRCCSLEAQSCSFTR